MSIILLMASPNFCAVNIDDTLVLTVSKVREKTMSERITVACVHPPDASGIERVI